MICDKTCLLPGSFQSPLNALINPGVQDINLHRYGNNIIVDWDCIRIMATRTVTAAWVAACVSVMRTTTYN